MLPLTSRPSSTAPFWVTVIDPDGLSETPAGTPVLLALGKPPDEAGGACVVGAGAGVVGAGACVVGAGAGVVGAGAWVVGAGAAVVGAGWLAPGVVTSMPDTIGSSALALKPRLSVPSWTSTTNVSVRARSGPPASARTSRLSSFRAPSAVTSNTRRPGELKTSSARCRLTSYLPGFGTEIL